MARGHGPEPWPGAMGPWHRSMAQGHGLGQWRLKAMACPGPWPGTMAPDHGPGTMASGNGPGPWPLGHGPQAMHQGHDPGPWPWTIALGHAPGPWPWTMPRATAQDEPNEPFRGAQPSATFGVSSRYENEYLLERPNLENQLNTQMNSKNNTKSNMFKIPSEHKKIRIFDTKIWYQVVLPIFGTKIEKPSQGILQDVHWAAGAFGYFPTYTLGNIYAGCLFEKMEKTIPNLDKSLSNGNLRPAIGWLAENIQIHGSLFEPRATVEKAIGNNIDVKPLLKYLEEKFTDLYDL